MLILETGMDSERRKEIIEIWKAIVDVQKHFNDIEMRIRGLFITIVLAIAAAQGFLMEKGLSFAHGETRILYATFIPLIGMLGTFLFYFMDKHWYHRLLVGAVRHGIKIEQQYQNDIPELGLSASIGEASPIRLRGWFTKLLARLVVADPKYVQEQFLHSDGKIELFYKPIAYLFIIVFIVTALFGGILFRDKAIATIVWAALKNSVCS
jgi:hypothetical protein